MAKGKAVKQRKKGALATPSATTGSQSGNKKPEISNDTKAQGFQERTQKPVSTTANQIASGLLKTKHKPSGPKQIAAPDPGNTKTCARFDIAQNAAIPFSSTTNRYSKFYLDDQRLLELRKAISLLFMLNEIPPQLAENPKPAPVADKAHAPARRALTLAEEERLAGVFVFLASTSTDPRKVTALCLEESSDHRALTIKLAANHGDLTDTKLHFENIARILSAAREGGFFLQRFRSDIRTILRSSHDI
jgi:hypothetical protein